MHRHVTTHLPRPAPASEQSLLEQLPMVRHLARRIHGRLPQNVEFDDVCSAGVTGLIDASAKFSSVRNVNFASYAQFRVRGAILDSLRALDWAPRKLRHKGKSVQHAIQALTSSLGHAPVEDEIAAELKISLYKYQQLRGDLNGLEIGSLNRKRVEEFGDEEIVDLPGRPEDDPLLRCIRGEVKERLTGAIKDLPEQERMVTNLRYYQEMTTNEIGLALGLDPIRVTQISASAVRHLREALSDISSTGGRKMKENTFLSMQAA
jgi:RNA polymerase sigma factor for flagellar operon FliA